MIATALAALIRFALGAASSFEVELDAGQRVFVANHTSHLDTLLIWASLPTRLRRQTRPVAAADYWTKTRLRRFLAIRLLNVVLIDRQGGGEAALALMRQALAGGDSLLLFPEGTRGTGNEPQAFKGGIYYLALSFPDLEIVPVCLENLNRILPKGEFLPVPLLARVSFGRPTTLLAGEEKLVFLERLRGEVVSLRGAQ